MAGGGSTTAVGMFSVMYYEGGRQTLEGCGLDVTFETEREDDGRWIAEVSELPGVLAYGATQQEALGKAEALALRALAEQIQHGEIRPCRFRSSSRPHEAVSVSQGAAGSGGA